MSKYIDQDTLNHNFDSIGTSLNFQQEGSSMTEGQRKKGVHWIQNQEKHLYKILQTSVK